MSASGHLLILTGASGSGKTTIAAAYAAAHPDAAELFHFDSVGVPPEAKMIAQYGSGEAWQRAMTHQWVNTLADQINQGQSALLEGQMRVAFIMEALESARLTNAACWLVHCCDATRKQRLENDRQQPDLANSRMMNWARYLRDEATQHQLTVLDTDDLDVDQCVNLIGAQLRRGVDICNATSKG